MHRSSRHFLNHSSLYRYQTKCAAAVTSLQQRQFAKASHESGLLEREFDYLQFDHKVDKGNWPHPYFSYMKVIGEEYNTRSEDHLNNLAQMEELSRELWDAVEQTMHLTTPEEEKLARNHKNDPR